MSKSNSILQELMEMGCPLALLPRTMPYAVPDNYFNRLPDIIENTFIDLNKPEEILGWDKTMPYSVPTGYFEQLTNNLVLAATIEHSTEKQAPYAAPPGYFEELPAQMLMAAKAADEGQRKIPPKKHGLFRPVQWAAAAIFIIFIGIGGYITFFNQDPANPDHMLASVSNSDIHNYFQRTYRMDVDRITGSNEIDMMQLDNKEIIEYLNETGWDIAE